MKKLILPIVLLVIAVGGYFAYTKGKIPAFSSGAEKELAVQLKETIEGMKGDKFGEVYKKMTFAIFPFDEMFPEGPEKDIFMKEFDKAFLGMSLEYDSIKTRTEPGKAIVDLKNVRMLVDQSAMRTPEQEEALKEMKSNPFFAALASGKMEQVMERISVIQLTDSPNHYIIDTSGPVDMYTGDGDKRLKFFTMKSDSYISEFKLDENKKIEMMSCVVKNLELIEGRGNTTLAKIGYTEFSFAPETPSGGKAVSSRVKYIVNDITFGDTIKIMLGQIEPLSFGLDATYNGDDLFALIKKIGKPEELKKINKWSSEIAIDSFYLKMGESGITADGDFSLDAKKLDTDAKMDEPVVKGEFAVKIVDYQKIVDYVTKSFPVTPEEANKPIAFLKEIGDEQGKDIAFEITFNADKLTVNGKDKDQIEAIRVKHFPPMAPLTEFQPSAPEPVQAHPIQ